jgi:alpha-L-fucosidase 2
LPALPTVWKDGSIKGLVTRGGFVIDMTWKNNKVSTLKVYSKLGGNCRLKLENTLKAGKGISLKKAKGKNPLFYAVEVKKPIISKEAKLPKVKLPKYNEYDVEMKAGQTYSFSAN